MKKKRLLLALLLIVALLCAGCGNNESAASAGGEKTAAEVPVVLNQAEYLLYQNIFYNNYGSQYTGQPVTKNGVFTVLQDAYSNVTRYYVWGFLDNTRCCDWQWEIVPRDTKNLPAPGSLVTVSGAFMADEKALDGYWIADAQIQTVISFTGESAELNMRTMSDTLERVQVINIANKPESFEGKTFTAYGRVAGPGILEDPYYDGSWQILYQGQTTASMAIGTMINLSGTVASGALNATTVALAQ